MPEEGQGPPLKLLDACRLALCTFESYKRALAANGNEPFGVPDWIVMEMRKSIANAERSPATQGE